MSKKQKWPRDLEVAIWYSYPHATKPDRKGFPKTELGVRGGAGGAAGALRLIAGGHASRIQVTNRKTGEVMWNALREKVAGTNVYTPRIVKGEWHFKTTKKGK